MELLHQAVDRGNPLAGQKVHIARPEEALNRTGNLFANLVVADASAIAKRLHDFRSVVKGRRRELKRTAAKHRAVFFGQDKRLLVGHFKFARRVVIVEILRRNHRFEPFAHVALIEAGFVSQFLARHRANALHGFVDSHLIADIGERHGKGAPISPTTRWARVSTLDMFMGGFHSCSALRRKTNKPDEQIRNLQI
ncbi:MAG: hypothetical protein R2724_00380 [Bryobacterales bacterium]